ncbi:hypothetical protein SU69_04700 [Thermosipho melanesiensis]|uniref:Uncharacterized protein n=2 Tax=Thermosipho melanesiensis TaxID=46541 RepID=A6LLI1_THEM4|nr:DUF5693 family protein [Thermosipho melanesiensis]ABR30782.1 hypothetical protein Tmel_0921 [Thermosipho melanesiensis BI429]APT73903.1 hypothetical protein BW47_04935 [Thermosipho melanesiensis]OOC35843.1 hypothetical protein SU68_04755 [Thermosipho melanesiensis]OOC38345.1 hypothetical protein SU69_04700 [Thermosipho melanesiensis]OOC38806.1 hypothetical protein SU70_04700 [Thermosipho melanesiensis]
MKIGILSSTFLNKILPWFIILALVSVFFRLLPDLTFMGVKVVFEDSKEVYFFDGKILPPKDAKYVILKDATEIVMDVDELKGKKFGILEFNMSYYVAQSFAENLDNVINVHYIKPEELENYNKDTLFRRLWRSVIERSIDLIVLPKTPLTMKVASTFEKYFGISEPISYIPKLEKLKYVYLIILVVFVFHFFPYVLFLIPLLYFSYSYFVSAVSIVGTIFIFKRLNNNILRFFSYYSLGIFTNLSLYDFEHLNNINVYRGVKLSLILLPAILLTELVITQKSEFKKHIKVFLPIFTIFGMYYIIRSGNYGFVLNFERHIREVLENVFIIRPRTKELLFYPFLFLSTYVDNMFYKKVFQLLGSIALISTFNTFCHIRAPMFINAYRELITLCVSLIVFFAIFSIIRLERSVLNEKNANSIHNRASY